MRKLLCLILLLGACTTFRADLPTTLEPPVLPNVSWQKCGDQISLSPGDAVLVLHFIDEYNAFRHAWERLR